MGLIKTCEDVMIMALTPDTLINNIFARLTAKTPHADIGDNIRKTRGANHKPVSMANRSHAQPTHLLAEIRVTGVVF